jgi:hypothetical protein
LIVGGFEEARPRSSQQDKANPRYDGDKRHSDNRQENPNAVFVPCKNFVSRPLLGRSRHHGGVGYALSRPVQERLAQNAWHWHILARIWQGLTFILKTLDALGQQKNRAVVESCFRGIAVWSWLVGTRAAAPRRELFWSRFLPTHLDIGQRRTDDLSTSPSRVRQSHQTGLCRVLKEPTAMEANAVFTFRTKERLSTQRIKEEVVRKARHVLKGAALAA